MNRLKALQSAERLLKVGRTQEALDEIQQIARAAPDDLVTLNRLGDLLARQGRRDEAIGYYDNIAERFAAGGFLPKAIAIYKKILRLDADNLKGLVRIGDMYLGRKLAGEARNYLLHAAEIALGKHRFAEAREVYEKLAKAEPDDPRHRIRVAEARAAEGDTAGAGDELVALGERLLEGGDSQQAEKIFRRAAELVPERAEPQQWLANCLAAQGRGTEALALLEQAIASGSGNALALRAELALRLDDAGRHDEALAQIADAQCVDMPLEPLQKLLERFIARGAADSAWRRLGEPLDEAAESDPSALAALLEAIGALEQPGHLPAVERLHSMHRRAGDRHGEVRALEWLVRIYREREMEREATRALERLAEIDPANPTLVQVEEPLPAEDVARAAEPSSTREAEGERPGPGMVAAPPAGTESLDRNDQEFIAGRLTQAEMLEKYGLRAKAQAQLEEIVARFPHHVETRQRIVALLRPGGGKRPLCHALVELALALHAQHRPEEARRTADEAASITSLAPRDRQSLVTAGLIEESAPEAAFEAEPAGGEIEIELDLGEIDAPPGAASSAAPEAEPAAAAAPPSRASEPGARVPEADMLEEIGRFIEDGVSDEAERRIQALRTLGYGGAALAALERRLAAARPARRDSAGAAGDDELSALTAALEEELFADESDDGPPLVPQAASEQSVDEIFAAFKRHVHAEVEHDDFRTHYDLGIAYKEMGLVDEALEQFELVARSGQLQREACSMLAICRRERGDLREAVACYRRALAASSEERGEAGLRYDLADVLLEAGEVEDALSLFRDVLQIDPGYRDVRRRVSDLEARFEV